MHQPPFLPQLNICDVEVDERNEMTGIDETCFERDFYLATVKERREWLRCEGGVGAPTSIRNWICLKRKGRRVFNGKRGGRRLKIWS